VFPSSLIDSWAISRHVLRKYKTAEVDLLRESNLQESTLVDVWLEVEARQYDPAITPIIYQHYLVPMRGGTPDQKLIGECIEKMKKLLGVYEARLSESKYLAGDFVSLADLSHFSYTVYFMRTPYASVFDSYPSVKGMVAGADVKASSPEGGRLPAAQGMIITKTPGQV